MVNFIYQIEDKILGIHEYINWGTGFDYAFKSRYHLMNKGILGHACFLIKRKDFLCIWKCLPENTQIQWCMLREADIKLQNELKKLNDKFDEQMKALIVALNNWKPSAKRP